VLRQLLSVLGGGSVGSIGPPERPMLVHDRRNARDDELRVEGLDELRGALERPLRGLAVVIAKHDLLHRSSFAVDPESYRRQAVTCAREGSDADSEITLPPYPPEPPTRDSLRPLALRRHRGQPPRGGAPARRLDHPPVDVEQHRGDEDAHADAEVGPVAVTVELRRTGADDQQDATSAVMEAGDENPWLASLTGRGQFGRSLRSSRKR